MPASELPLLLEIEQPQPGSAIGRDGRVSGYGWVLAGSRILELTIALGDTVLCRATTGLARGEIAERHPHYPDREQAGFRFAATLPDGHAGGKVRLRAIVRTATETVESAVPVVLRKPRRVPEKAAPQTPEPPEPPVSEPAPRPGPLTVPGAAPARLRPEVPTAPVDTSAEPNTPPSPGAPMQALLEEARVDAKGILRVRGWAVSLTAIEQIGVFLDNRPLGLAETRVSREDVGRAFPDYPGARDGGFLFQQELDDAALAGRTVRILVTAAGGVVGQMTAPLSVPPAIERQVTGERLVRLHCDLVSLSEEGTLSVVGWAVCESGVDRIAIEIGDEAAGIAELGIDRPDVGNQFPSVPGARKAGFRFSRDLGKRYEGDHSLSLTVRGCAGETQMFRRPTRAEPAAPRHAIEPPAAATERSRDLGRDIRCFLDVPVLTGGAASEPVRGFMSLAGWALSPKGIAGVEVFVDGRSVGDAYFGIRREDIQAAFPEVDGSLLCGFAMLVPPQVLRQGFHAVLVKIRDNAGGVAEIGFTVEAEPATEGPGPWSIRRKVSPVESELSLRLLDAAGWRPLCHLMMRIPGLGAAEMARARQTLATLCDQAYPDWHLTIVPADGADQSGVARKLLAGFEDIAGRVEIVDPGADFRLADLAPVEAGPALIAPIMPGDELGEDALLELALAGAEGRRRPKGGADGDGKSTVELLYSDERRPDPADGVTKAFFKPDWSPDLLLSTNYIGRLWAASPDLLRRADVRLGDFARHGEYDVVLRLTEAAREVGHIARVLCERGRARLDNPALERRALERAMERRGITGAVEEGVLPGSYRVRRAVQVDGLVSIVIPTMASRGLIETAIGSIRGKTRYHNFEIVCLENIPVRGSEWKGWLRRNADTVLEMDEPFNWSRFNNKGAAAARGEFLLFLNDDIEILDEGWLEGLLEHAQRPEIGVVGPQLLYPDGKVQHAGMFLSRSVGRHAFRFAPRDEPGPFGLATTTRNVISVTGACMLMRRAVFDELGGFDETHAVINNDVDFCLRTQRSGRLVLYTPHVTLIHHEMVSRAGVRDIYDVEQFDQEWTDLFRRGDPYFNPHLTLDYDDYVTEPEPVQYLHVGNPVVARDHVRRILAVKLDHLGDFVSAFPAFRRLKRHFPGAELTVLAAAGSVALASLEPAIDRVIEFNFYHAVSEKGARRVTRREWLTLERHLHQHRFDLAVDLRRQPDTRPVLQHTGARWLAGFEHRNMMSWLDVAVEWEGDAARNRKQTHVTDALLQLVDAVALACDPDRNVVERPATRAQARAIVAALPGLDGVAETLFARPVVAMHVGAGAENKRWPPESFAGLIDLLVGQEAVNVLLVGGRDDQEAADRVLERVRRKEFVFSLVERTALKDLPALLLASDLFVGNDSGPKHLAAGLGVPTVGIHSGSVDAAEWGPLGPSAVAIRRDMKCSPCYLATVADCHRGLACLRGITIADVYRACRRLLILAEYTASHEVEPLAPELPAEAAPEAEPKAGAEPEAVITGAEVTPASLQRRRSYPGRGRSRKPSGTAVPDRAAASKTASAE